MDDNTGPLKKRYGALAICGIIAWIALIVYLAMTGTETTNEQPIEQFFPPNVIIFLACLLVLSAFFSASETSFLSINKFRLLSMAEESSFTARMVSKMMTHAGGLLTTILVGNMIVNILISVVLGNRAVIFLDKAMDLHPVISYILAVAICTSLILFFGEIVPKVIAMRMGERMARAFVVPLMLINKILGIVRETLLGLTDFIFKITRFKELRAGPFMTDEEFESILSDIEANGVIEEEQRQMIQGILKFTDAPLREILVPRPDVIALQEDVTVEHALGLLKKYEFSRMPVFKENLDQIVGVLFAKDLLASVDKGDLYLSISKMLKPIQFVPETMSIHKFVKHAQRKRCHIAVVVDEYGGTEGIVTLEDALEEVVGDILDEDEIHKPPYKRISNGVYEVDGSMPLDELAELLETKFEDEEHETVAGFVMSKIDKIPEVGDHIKHGGIQITVKSVEGKRVEALCIMVKPDMKKEQAG